MMSQMLDLASLIWLAVLMVLAVLRRTAARPSRVCLVPLSSCLPEVFIRSSRLPIKLLVSWTVTAAVSVSCFTVVSVSCSLGS